MKTKLFVVGLFATAALVGCTNDEFVESTNASGAKGETLLVFDGFGSADTKLAYQDQNFQWQGAVSGSRAADQIGVRRVSENGVDVISNSMFFVQGTSNENTGDPADWTGTQGKYACFATEFETLHEADYIVTYPYDREAVQDGKVTGKLAVMQVANKKTDGNLYEANEYAGNYGFMMSTATHFVGGQQVGHFNLYPVFARLQFNVTHNTNQTDVQLQSIILKSKSGEKVFPTELEVSADVTTVGGYLDESKMTATENNMTDQIALTVNGEKAVLNSTTPATFYLTVIPGTYSTADLELKFVTNKGSYTMAPSGESVTWGTGYYYPINVKIDKFEPNRDYIAADAYSWMQAMKNISNLNPADGNEVDIRVAGEIEMTEAQFRVAQMNTTQKLRVIDGGKGSIVITDGMDNTTDPGKVTNSLATTIFDIPVTVKGDLTNLRTDEDLTFSELNVTGNLNPQSNGTDANFKKLYVKSGSVNGTTTYHTEATDAAMTLENVTFTGNVKVDAMQANGNVAASKTTKVNFNNCIFANGLTVQDNFKKGGEVVVTVNGGQIVNNLGTSTLTVGEGQNPATLYLKGDVEADEVKVAQSYDVFSGKVVLDLMGNLQVNSQIEMPVAAANDYVEFFVEKDATLTLAETATFTAHTDDIVIEGTLVNNGEFIVDKGIMLSDDDQDNNHLGKVINNGFLMAASDDWYEDQHIEVTYGNGCEYVISGVASVTDFNTAKAIANVTGMQLTGTSYAFDANSDFAEYDLYVAETATLKAVNGKFGNLNVAATKTLTLNNNGKYTTQFENVLVSGTLVMDLTSGTTLSCGNFTINKGGKLTNGNQVTCESFVNNGTVENGNPAVLN